MGQINLVDEAARCNQLHDRIVQHVRDAVETAVALGRRLIVVKSEMGSRMWSSWIETDCHFTAGHAARYIQAAERVEKLGAIVEDRIQHGEVLSLRALTAPPPKPKSDKPKAPPESLEHAPELLADEPAPTEAPAPPEPEPEPEPLPDLPNDCSADFVLPAVRAALADRDHWQAIIRDLQKIGRHVRDSAGRHAESINLQTVETELKNARRAIKYGMPHAPCVLCEQTGRTEDGTKKGAQCRQCNGLGWLSLDRYNHVPEDMR